MSKRVELARKAYEKGSIEETKKAHKKEVIHEEGHKKSGEYIGDFVYGALDGIVTTFAVVSGVTGAGLSVVVILVLGFANLLADGLSMAAGNYLGTKSEREYYKKEKQRESWEVENVPEGEREEIREIYRRKGFKGKDLERAVKIITSDKETWVKTMMLEELNMIEDKKSPIRAGVVTFVAFFALGLIPVLTYVASYLFGFNGDLFLTTVILTLVAMFAVGSVRSLVIKKKWYIAGLEMLVIGGTVALVSYYTGFFISTLI
jgi:VIT1/CCC1 family predicted Fe2+/Mn2+ transporter